MASNLFELAGSITVKIDEAVNGMEKVTGQAEKTASGMVDKFKGAAKVIGAVFAIDKIIDFGKLAVNAAAEAQALEAQFEQVFGSMQGQANEMINGMAEEFGMLPERVMPSFTQLTSMFKGVGMEATDAMNVAEQVTTSAADAAAFYDVSMESAQASLTSFIKGNYEAGESVGIFATDAQLAQFAIEQGVVSSTAEWQKLDEATKMATRADYITNMQEMSGATGQAAREADGFENVMGNLKASWQKFLAVVGGPILKAVIPIIQGITNGVVWLAEAIKPVTDKISEWLTPLGDIKGMFAEVGQSGDSAFGGLIDTFNKVKVAIESVWDLLTGGTVKENTDLMEQMGFSDDAIAFVIGASEMIQGAIDEMKVAWEGLQAIAKGVWDNIKMAIQFFIDWYSTTFMLVFETISEWWKENQDTILSTAKSVWDTIMNTLDVIFTFINDLFHAVWDPLVAWFNENQELIKTTISTVWNAILAVITFIMEKIVPAIIDKWNTIMEFLQPILDAIVAIVKTVMNYILGIIKAIMQAINGDWSGAWETIKETVQTFLSSAREIVSNLLTKMWNIVKEKSKGMFDAIKEWFGKIPGKIEEQWGKAQSFLEGINLVQIGKNIFDGLWKGMKDVWAGIQRWISNKASELPGWIKKPLGIASPSKVMAKEVGRWIPIGLAEGIDGAGKYVEKAMSKMSNVVSGASFSVPDVAMASDYTFKPQPTQAQQNSNNLLEEVIYLLRKLLQKDTDLIINGRVLSEEILDDINYLNDLYNNRDTRIRGGVAYP